MKPIPPEYRQFVIDRAPEFVEAVSDAKRLGQPAGAALSSFRENPFLLYAALWYASGEGVIVTMTP